MATNETNVPNITGAKAAKREPGFNAEGKAYPGVDPDTGERKAVTWAGLREEFGIREGSKLYNDIGVAGFGGIQPGRPAHSLVTLQDAYMRTRRANESEEEYVRVKERFAARRAKVEQLLAEAEGRTVKGA
jgi:hypothetical protein